jgi:4-hydroxy-tetrahydrodipicolinate synthase
MELDGIIPIIPTPFREDEAIAWDWLPGLIDFACAAGACAVCLPAYGSEFYKLSEDERLDLVAAAARHARGRLPVIAQVNHPSLREAVRLARMALDRGASAIGTAVPRLFAVSHQDIYAYLDGLLREIPAPFVIQDFNPGGPTIPVDLAARLHAAHPHFRYLKLEEPLMGAKVHAIREATGGTLGVLEGWGGMYTLELAPEGIAGVVPGLALTDLLERVFRLARTGRRAEAFPIFAGILPQILYSLQNLELFHHAEKRLLAARGVLPGVAVRALRYTPTAAENEYLDFVNGRVVALLDLLGMPRDPRGGGAA